MALESTHALPIWGDSFREPVPTRSVHGYRVMNVLNIRRKSLVIPELAARLALVHCGRHTRFLNPLIFIWNQRDRSKAAGPRWNAASARSVDGGERSPSLTGALGTSRVIQCDDHWPIMNRFDAIGLVFSGHTLMCIPLFTVAGAPP